MLTGGNTAFCKQTLCRFNSTMYITCRIDHIHLNGHWLDLEFLSYIDRIIFDLFWIITLFYYNNNNNNTSLLLSHCWAKALIATLAQDVLAIWRMCLTLVLARTWTHNLVHERRRVKNFWATTTLLLYYNTKIME